MEIQIHRTLLATGYFHVDDLDPLGVPPIASEVKGTLINSVRARGYMKSTEVRRKVAHAAANARKAPIYKITAEGRHALPKLIEDLQTDLVGVSADGLCRLSRETRGGGKKPHVSTHSGESGTNQPGSGVGVANPQGPPDTPLSPVGTGTASSDNKPLTGVGGGNEPGLSPVGSGASGHSSHSGEDLPGDRGQAEATQQPVDADPGEPTRLFDGSPPSVYDPWKDAA